MKTTIITPTIGSPELEDCLLSIALQDKEVAHLLVVDGMEYESKVQEQVDRIQAKYPAYDPDMIILPWNTGKDRMNGHRIYAAIPQLIGTEYFAMLDEDNALRSDWVSRMEQALMDPSIYFVTCRRLVMDRSFSTVIGSDTHESIGSNAYGYILYDTSTWLLRTEIMAKYMHYMIVPEIGDRAISEVFYEYPHRHIYDYYGTLYRAPERLYDFFDERKRGGNQ